MKQTGLAACESSTELLGKLRRTAETTARKTWMKTFVGVRVDLVEFGKKAALLGEESSRFTTGSSTRSRLVLAWRPPSSFLRCWSSAGSLCHVSTWSSGGITKQRRLRKHKHWPVWLKTRRLVFINSVQWVCAGVFTGGMCRHSVA